MKYFLHFTIKICFEAYQLSGRSQLEIKGKEAGSKG